MWKWNKTLQFYYSFALCAVLGAFLLGGFKLWSFGTLNPEKIASIYESNVIVEDIKQLNSVRTLEQWVYSDKTRQAIKRLDEFEKKLKIIEGILPDRTTSQDLRAAIQNVKKDMNGMLSFPEMTKVFLILYRKVHSFYKFVSANNYRTLTRLSSRLTARVKPYMVKNQNKFSYSNIQKVVRLNTKDIATMEKVTNGSVLSDQEKYIILAKLKTLKTESKMLNKYLVQLKKFRETNLEIRKTNEAWFKYMEPNIALSKMNFEAHNGYILMGGGALIFFLIGTIIVGGVIYRKNAVDIKERGQRLFIDMLKNRLLGNGQHELDEKFDEAFSTELDKFRDYVHKRMSFGSIFQEGIPFSSIILDEKLNLVWGNRSFYETWSLEDYFGKEDSLTWDYVQRFTNLGENDPVICAINEGIAGIYQIQVKSKNQDQAVPYEMYVSPVEYSGERRVLIFFYCLRSLQETITSQTKSIVGPVTRTLDSMYESKFDKEFQNKVKKDFGIAGIEHIFDRFIKLNALNLNHKAELFKEIELLENLLMDKHKLIEDMNKLIDRSSFLDKECSTYFETAKTEIVSIVALKDELTDMYSDVTQVAKTLVKDEADLIHKLQGSNEIIEENIKAFTGIKVVREKVKAIKNEVDESKSRVIQALDQSLILGKSDKISRDQIEQGLGKMKLDVRSLDNVLSSFTKTITQLDVALSKIEMLCRPRDGQSEDIILRRFSELKERVNGESYNVGRVRQDGTKREDLMIAELKNLYSSFQVTRSTHHKMKTIVTNELQATKAEAAEMLQPGIDHPEMDQGQQVDV